MKKIAIIGFGNHVTKNILPAINRMKDLVIDAVYVRNPNKYLEKCKDHKVLVKGISGPINDDVEWIYISTPISTHFELASKYIKLGKNVICEKPLTDSLDRTRTLFDLANEHHVQLHEVNMYQYHKQYQHLSNIVDENFQGLKCLKTRFTIPHLDKNDIRYNKKLGGGALLDVGFYPVSLIFSLFGKPKEIKSVKYSEDNYEVDLFGSAIFVYENFYCLAEWGIGLPYSNQALVITDQQEYTYDRIFSKPETLKTKVQIKKGFKFFDEDVGEDDQFVNFLKEIFNKNIVDKSKGTIQMASVFEEIKK